MIKYLTIALCVCSMNLFGQANQELDNLLNVSINDHLIPQSSKNLGEDGAHWNDFYIGGTIFLEDQAEGDDLEILMLNGNKFLHTTGVAPDEVSPSCVFLGELAGQDALASAFGSQGNVGIGFSALEKNTDGDHNVAVGWLALSEASGGSKNTMVGSRAGQNIQNTGEYNVGIGHNVFYETGMAATNIQGDENIAIGAAGAISETRGVLGVLTTGSQNTVVGTRAGIDVSIGDNNTILGFGAGDAITEGDENIFLGSGAGAGASGTIDGHRNIVIGIDQITSTTDAVDELNIGNALFGKIHDATSKQISVGNSSGTLGSMFNVGANDEFQVSSSGEIVEYSGLATDGIGVPIILDIVQFSDETGNKSGDLLASAPAGLYQVTYQGIVTQASDESSGLIFQAKYTDEDAGVVVTIPDSNYPYVNYAGDNDANESVLSGTLMIDVENNTDIEYKVSYQSTHTMTEMRYSMRIVLTRLN